MNHPCQYSPEVLEAFVELIKPNEYIHDPFAGTGIRLGQLCDKLGARFTGVDIEDWPGKDPRVFLGDATTALAYPLFQPFTVVTSPVYLNKRLADYKDGPKPTTKTKGRRDYGIALGRPLHERNLARWTGKEKHADQYWALHEEAVGFWGERVILNVDQPLERGWEWLLREHGYFIVNRFAVYTRRYGGLANAEIRAEHEVVLEAVR